MSAIDVKYAALGGSSGFLGAPVTAELMCPDGVGRFRHYNGGSIYWSPPTGARVIYGAIRHKWSQLGWERSFLGYPITDETPTPDSRGRFNHFEGGSIYWTPQTGAYEVHGAIRHKWAQLGWERGELGYPISDELPSAAGSPHRYSDFENGVLYWRNGRAASTLSRLTIGGASKTAEEVLHMINGITLPLIIKKVNGRQIYTTGNPVLGGLEPPGRRFSVSVSGKWDAYIADLEEFKKPVTEYRWDGSRVRNRWYKWRVPLGIEVKDSADIKVDLDLRIEVFLDSSKRSVLASLRQWGCYVEVPWPTSWVVSADEVAAQLRAEIDPHINKLHVVGGIPAGLNILSVKVQRNGDLDLFMEPVA